MIRYLLKRLLLLIPSLFFVTLVAFTILINCPGDPIDRLVQSDPESHGFHSGTQISEIRKLWITKLGLDLPLFYISIHSKASEKSSVHDADMTQSREVKNQLINYFIPVFHWQLDNRFHRWLFGDGNWLTGEGAIWSKGIIRGDFGLSYQTRQPVSRVIGDRIVWSLSLSVLSIVLAYLISIPLTVYSVQHPGGITDKVLSTFSLLAITIPSFWLATLLLFTFANPDCLQWFPASGVKPPAGYPENADFFTKVFETLPYLILPVICYTYSSIALLSRTLKSSLLESLDEDYSRTARAKGLSGKRVVSVHGMRNSLLPMITLAARIFPAAIGGSVIIETIFSIPGMGSETVMAIQNQNYPMIIAVFTITAFLTMIGFLIADIGYAIADPRIVYGKSKT